MGMVEIILYATYVLPSSDSLGIITLPVCYGRNKVYISNFYQPPNSGSQVF